MRPKRGEECPCQPTLWIGWVKLRAAWCEGGRLGLLLLGLLLCCPSLVDVHSNVTTLLQCIFISMDGRLRLGGFLCVIGNRPWTWLRSWRLNPGRSEIGYHRSRRVSWCRCVV